jgi:protein-S-isoprenylcysteine O-methyltransferase Ste14
MSDAGQRAFAALRGAVAATLFVTLWTWLAMYARRFDPALGVQFSSYLRPAGWVVAAAGAVLCASCVIVFAMRGRGTPAPFDPPRVFVAIGPYRYVRNPMYIGAICVLLGGALLLDSPAIALLALFAWLCSHLFVLGYEERALERRFGVEYLKYRAGVNRWWPSRRPRG